MNRRSVLWLSMALAASGALGCQRVLDFVHNLTGGGQNDESTPGGGGTGAPQPAAAATGSVRTPAPTRATGCPAHAANAALPAGTVHNGAVDADETWTLEGSPHRVPEGLNVNNGATLTLAPCAVVLVGHGHGFEVHDGGGLVAAGDAEHPIRVGSDNPQPQAGDWQAVWLGANVRRTSRLSHVIIEHGGADWNGRSSCLGVVATGLHADHVTARQCRAFGVGLFDNGTFSPDSSDLVVNGAVAGNAALMGAVFVQRAPSVASVPTGTYTGNAADEVFVAEAGSGNDTTTIRQSALWKNLGVPYHLADDQDLRVDGPTAPVLTIAPGVTLRFGRGAGVSVGYDAEGGLVMDGGAEATRIVLRPAGTDESPGQWHGVYLGPRTNRSATRLRYVTIRNAAQGWNASLCDWEGGTGDAAFLMAEVQPNPGSLDHLVFAVGAPESVAFGRMWAGAPVDINDPAMGNDFAQFGPPCHQSPMRDPGGQCPDPPPRCN